MIYTLIGNLFLPDALIQQNELWSKDKVFKNRSARFFTISKKKKKNILHKHRSFFEGVGGKLEKIFLVSPFLNVSEETFRLTS